MSLTKIEKIILIILGSTLICSLLFYPFLPNSLATHWSISGNADGFTSKAIALFGMPFICLVIFFFALSLPKVEHKPERKLTQLYYDLFVLAVVSFILYIQLLTILWNLGLRFHIGQFISLAFGAGYFVGGEVLGKYYKRLSLDRKLVRLFVKILRIAGVIALTGIIFKMSALFLSFLFIAVAAYIIKTGKQLPKINLK